MRNIFLSLVSCLAAGTATLLVPGVALAEFGEAGNVSIAIERTFGIHYVHDTVDPEGPGSDSSGGTTVGLGWYVPGTIIHQPRAAVDVFVIDRLSVGGSLAFFTESGDGMLGDGDGVLFAPRVGYRLPLSRTFDFWPRGGVTFVNVGGSSLFGLGAEATFVGWVRPHWGVLLSATLDLNFIGSIDYGVDDDAEWSQFSFGIPSVGLVATF